MKFVLADKTINLILDGKPYNLSLESSFNFKAIHSLLLSGDYTEDQIRELLKPPKEVEGFYTVYDYKNVPIVVDKVKKEGCILPKIKDKEYWGTNPNLNLDQIPVLGVYPNIKSIIHDFPEYFL